MFVINPRCVFVLCFGILCCTLAPNDMFVFNLVFVLCTHTHATYVTYTRMQIRHEYNNLKAVGLLPKHGIIEIYKLD